MKKLIAVAVATLTLVVAAPAWADSASVGSVREAVPSRGFTMITVSGTSDACPSPSTPPQACLREFDARVQPAAVACSPVGTNRPSVGSSFIHEAFAATATSISKTQVTSPAVVGGNRVCVYTLRNSVVTALAQAVWVSPTGPYPQGDFKNCSDFPTQRAAQDEFNKWRPTDPYVLDPDNDGIACKGNPCPCYYGSEWPIPAGQVTPPAPQPPQAPQPQHQPQPQPQPPAGTPPLPRLTFSDARYYVRKALARSFRASYRRGYAKRIARCSRSSRTRIRCNRVSWIFGDMSFRGRIAIWYARDGHGKAFSYFAYRIKRTNQGCRAAHGRQCTKTFRVP